MKSRLTGKDPDAGKDGGQEQKGMTEYEMVGCCSPWRLQRVGYDLMIEQQQRYQRWSKIIVSGL